MSKNTDKKDHNVGFKTVANESAKSLIANRIAVRDKIHKDMIPELKARAFSVAGLEDERVAHRVNQMLAEIPDGGDWRDVRSRIAGEISPKGGIGAEQRAERIIRDNVFQAYASARYRKQMADKDIMPYLVYHTVNDERTRPTHRALDGMVLPVDDPFWRDHYPPWDFGCRCTVSGMTESEAKSLRGKPRDDRGIRIISHSEAERIAPPSANGFSFTPQSMAMSLDDVGRLQYMTDERLVSFSRKMREEHIDGLAPNGASENVWEWMLKEQLKEDTRHLREVKNFTKVGDDHKPITPETIIIRDAETGKKVFESTGSTIEVLNKDAASLMNRKGRKYIAIHTHTGRAVAFPSLKDIESAFERASMSQHIVSAIDSSSFKLPDVGVHELQTIRREIRAMYKQLDDGKIGRKEFEDWLSDKIDYTRKYGDEGIDL